MRGSTLAVLGWLVFQNSNSGSAQKAPPSTAATPTTYHPRITSVSPTTPRPGQIVTINGSDLLPPTWSVALQYKDKYGGGFHEIALSGTSSALTFSTPTNMRPDSIGLQFTNASQTEALNNPIPSTERHPFLPVILVQEKPKIDASSFVSVSADGGGTFNAFPFGSRTIRGQNFLKPPVGTVTLSGGTTGTFNTPTLSSTFTIDQAPTVSLGALSFGVSDPKYIAGQRDETTITAPSSAAHNATGFLKFATPAGVDSTRITIARAPQATRVFEAGGSGPLLLTNGQIVRDRTYEIHGQNLVVRQITSSTSSNPSVPTVTIGGISLNLLNTVFTASNDTVVFFKVPASLNTTGGALGLSHAGGSVTVGTFSVLNQPAPLQISGAVISTSDIIAGSSATITLSLSPSPTNFSTAGELSFDIPSSLAPAINPISSVAITRNPMTIVVPTKVIQTSASGSIVIRHNTTGGGSASLPVTVRPPRPTAVALTSDTVPGSTTAAANVSFDLPGTATVLLSSSDPTIASVPATATRSGTTATFSINTVQVAAPHTVTISASLNGVSASKAIVVRPGRLASITANPSTVIAGDSIPVTLSFDAPVSGLSVALSGTDTAIKSRSVTASGSSVQTSLTTTRSLISNVIGNVNASDGRVTRSTDVQVRPIQITQFSVSPTSGAAGTTIPATVHLGRVVSQVQTLQLASSDTSVATVASSLSFNPGDDTKVVSVTLRSPTTANRTATITATLHTTNSTTAGTVSSVRTTTVTVTP